MIITSSTLNALRTGLNHAFQNGQSRAQPSFREVATVVPSSTASNTYAWLGQFPGFREWIGERQFNSMKEHSYSITNKTFEDSIEIGRDEIEDDNVGTYSIVADEMGYAAEVFPDELVYGLLKNGTSEVCYDGQYFFDSDHPVNSKVDGSGTDASVSNLIIDDGYTGPTWYLLDTSRALKPLIFQERRKVNFTSMTQNTDQSVFINNKYQFGADMRCNVGFGFWQMAVAVRAEMTPDNIWGGIERLQSFSADGGRNLGLGKHSLKLISPKAKYKKALQISKREQINDGGVTVSNELKDMFSVVNPDFL